jgi:hypothetical protein
VASDYELDIGNLLIFHGRDPPPLSSSMTEWVPSIMLFFPSEAFGKAYLDIIVLNYACYKLQTSFFLSLLVSVIIFLCCWR